MPRQRTRKTSRGMVPKEKYVKAAEEFFKDGKSLRSIAKNNNLCHVTLDRFIRKTKLLRDSPGEAVYPAVGYRAHNRVFSDEYEIKLDEYINHCADLYYGLTTKCVRELAYHVAEFYKLEMPTSWKVNRMAGKDWLLSFMKRNETLSIRKPEQTSLARAMNFNKPNVSKFFNNLLDVLNRFKFEPQDVYNIDETGLTTVHKPTNVIARKGKKQIGAIASAERGTLVTMCLAVNAIGNTIPPMFIFPLKKYSPAFLKGGPIGSIGAANKSGWMQSEFLSFMEHLVKHTNATKSNRKLVLLDNHQSHLSLPVVNFCRENGIVLLTFPPHCSHKLQPLDRSVFGPLKIFFNQACTNFMKSNAGNRIRIYDIPELAKIALEKAATATNILSGFRVSGTWPVNPDVFGDDEFAPSIVTDRPSAIEVPNMPLLPTTSIFPNIIDVNMPSTSSAAADVDTINFSPEVVMPYPKSKLTAIPARGGRKRGRTVILTDTPEKNLLEEEQNKKLNKTKSQHIKKTRLLKPKLKKGQKVKDSLSDESSGEEEDSMCSYCLGKFSESIPKEQWVQCTSCKMWVHARCVGEKAKHLFFECRNCDSD